MSVDPRQIRDAMGHFATGITVVTTTDNDGNPVGMTVNSFNSVSLEPPLVLFSIARDASCFDDICKADKFAVNILSADQQDVSVCFAKSSRDGFNQVVPNISANGIPFVANSLAVFECSAFAQHDGGDHVIFIGKVIAVDHASEGNPLLYFRGKYTGVAGA